MGPSLQNGTLNPSPDYISVIDLATQRELRHIQTGLGSIPCGVFATAGKLYFTAEGYDVVERYDLASKSIG
jgi:hypothetical protein